jgi:DNA polymerase-3 subunit gamma/tau
MPESNAFVATARKYRPRTFGDILAQPGVTVTLKNALATGRLHHAFLFCGPRGTGKTTTARVLARALNCADLKEGEPCGTCKPCVQFTEGRSLDVIEIDGASNRGVDDIRSLRERVAYAAAGGGYKVYIVDEVHMLTNEAFNALLKTLEEPPPHVVFIFATTEPAKVPPTIISRCQRFDFRRIAPEPIVEAIHNIVKSEALDIDDEAVALLARRAQGSLRDAYSLLDQTGAYAEGRITRETVEEALGIISEDAMFKITALWAERKTAEAFALLAELWEAGIDPAEWASAFGEHLRDLVAACVGGEASPGGRFDEAAKPFALGDLLRAQVMLSDLKLKLRVLGDPRPEVEVYVLRLLSLADTVMLSQALAGAGTRSAPRPASDHPASRNPGTRNPASRNPGTDTAPSPAPHATGGPAVDPRLDLRVAPVNHEPEELPVEPWDRFLVILRKKAPWAAAQLRQGKLESHKDGQAQFFIPDSNQFNRDRFGSTGIRKAVTDAFDAVYGERPKVEFRFGESERKGTGTKALLEDNPELASLIEATDGEIVARRPRRKE